MQMINDLDDETKKIEFIQKMKFEILELRKVLSRIEKGLDDESEIVQSQAAIFAISLMSCFKHFSSHSKDISEKIENNLGKIFE